jgi:hypothetical protein
MKMSMPTKLAHSYVAVRFCYTDMTFQLFVNKDMFPPFIDSQERLHLSGTLANKTKDGSSYSGSLVETCVIQSLQFTHRTLDRCHSFESGRMSPSSAIANSSKLGCVELASGSGEQCKLHPLLLHLLLVATPLEPYAKIGWIQLAQEKLFCLPHV